MDRPTPTTSARTRIARFGLFEADLERRVLTREGLRVRLQDQPFLLLDLLLHRPGEVVTREEIQQKLWPADTYVAFDDGLNTAVKKLRLALGDSADNPRFIETVPRRGYRLLAPVAFEGGSPASQENPAAVSTPVSAPPADSAPALHTVSRRSPALLWGGLLVLAALAIALLIWRKARTAPGMGSASATARSQHSSRATDPRAREEYLKARNFWKQRTAEALTQAVDHYNLALELDPNYAEAYAGLANCYVVMPLMSTVRMEDSYLRASQATEKALALDDSLAEAHLAAAEIKFYSDWNFPGAEIEFRRSLELDSTDPQAHQWYAEFLSLMGRHQEAIAQIQTAQQLDPSSMIIHHQAGQIYQSARMYPEALLAYRRALMIEPGFGPTYSAMALAYRRQGLYAECLEAERHANPYWDPDGTNLKDLKRVADAYAANGKQGFLRASLTFNKKHPGAAYFFAHDYALLGENDEALKWLQQALASHRPEVLNLQNDPEFDRLRADPRFQEIAKKVGIPQPVRAESAGRGGSS